MNRFVVLALRSAEQVTVARYSIQAAHALSGAMIVLDLTDVPADACSDWRKLLAEFVRTATGNRQHFAVLRSSQGLEQFLGNAWQGDAELAGLVSHEDLESCLRVLAVESAADISVVLTVPSRIEYLGPIKRSLGQAVRARHGESEAFRIEILVDELCLNAVENSPSDRSDYEIDFRLRPAEVQIDVTNVFDDSVNSERIMQRRLKSFDPSGDYLGERGRGLFLVARLADGMQIRSLPGGRICVSVVKRLGAEPGTPVPPS